MIYSERVLILCPVKNAARYLDTFQRALATLTYRRGLLSLGLLEKAKNPTHCPGWYFSLLR
jgi:hypothetical protein